MFVIDEAADVVFCGVGAEALFAMLFDAKADVVGESYVETAGTAGEDVDVEMIFPLRHVRRIREESAAGKQIPSLHCGMTNKKASAKTRTNATAKTEADPFASLRNDKQKGERKDKNKCNCKDRNRFLRFTAE
jgi:hypothetical protein